LAETLEAAGLSAQDRFTANTHSGIGDVREKAEPVGKTSALAAIGGWFGSVVGAKGALYV
jgi:hypothetical protein